ncbi:hypothetical protein TraAM80_08364 [Trypanosoma rangeli]|uniref:Uncharacterized protein n=1 Tax=Trypanosoma rangeli TaxID=5698 RepID=A0A3R7RB29_TRYRA|nr:uncharacterized protein TraAM80_08364 [Trypanosoma rangeli]RNE99137.1 hypothetical protein TraAM80_08364 [Trypanosoma rangeli]|eukprot:RNE99137.1 hypothetical protein TraAM80_08364 [Trypanosoma rangeli]
MSETASFPPHREERLDSLFDTAMEAVAELERCRARLHGSLQAAHFLYSDVQREMDRAGLILGLEAVPTKAGALRPQLGLVCLATAAEETATKKEEEQSQEYYEFAVVSMADGGENDSAHWFASAPSVGLRECQQRFREVVNACVQVVQAQKRAMEAAEAYRAVVAQTA